jgi:serine/threonine-protein kinase ATR
MVKELLAMSEREVPENEFTLGMQKHFPGLARLAPSKLIMPLQEYLTANLPPASTDMTHQPFPLNIPRFMSKYALAKSFILIAHSLAQSSMTTLKS